MARQTVVRVKHRAAMHDAGTKFYEVFLFENDFGGFFVSRYGKAAQQDQGGQESFEAAPPTTAEEAFNKKVRQKFSEKGGYTHEIEWHAGCSGGVIRNPLAPGFSRVFTAGDGVFNLDALRNATDEIFNSPAVFQQMCDALNLPGAEDIEMVPIVVFEEVPEEVRAADASWGAW